MTFLCEQIGVAGEGGGGGRRVELRFVNESTMWKINVKGRCCRPGKALFEELR